MATKTLNNIRTRHTRDTSANWTKYDPVLLSGEIIIVDTASGEVRYKVGDGVKKYSQLPFDDEAVRALIDAHGVCKQFDNPALTSSNGVCTWTVNHNMNKKVVFNIIEVDTKEEVLATTIVTSNNTLTVKFGSTSNIAAGKYRITVIGSEVSA